MLPLGIHHVAIKVRDVAVCERFYADQLGLRVTRRQPHSVWLALGDEAILMLEQGEGGPDLSPLGDSLAGLHLLALRIARADRAAWASRLPVVAETAYTLYVRDPEGNRIGLSHHPEPVSDSGSPG